MSSPCPLCMKRDFNRLENKLKQTDADLKGLRAKLEEYKDDVRRERESQSEHHRNQPEQPKQSSLDPRPVQLPSPNPSNKARNHGTRYNR
eukprot:78152-Rhodomonas_salina.1